MRNNSSPSIAKSAKCVFRLREIRDTAVRRDVRYTESKEVGPTDDEYHFFFFSIFIDGQVSKMYTVGASRVVDYLGG